MGTPTYAFNVVNYTSLPEISPELGGFSGCLVWIERSRD